MLQGNIVRLLIGQFLSQVGDWVAYVALPLVVLAKTGSPVLVSFSLLFEMLPAFIVGPVAGVVVDRYNRRTIMLLSDFVRAALLVVMALTDQLWLLLTAAFLVGAVSQFFVPAIQASFPNLIDKKEELLKVNSLRQSLSTMAVIAGPTLGGIIASLVGTTAAFVVDAVSFLVSATLLLTVRIPFTRAKASGGRLLAEVWSGFRYVLNNGVLLGAILIIGASVLGAAALNALEPLYARQISTKGELTFGLMVTAWGGGMLGGAILLMRVGEKWGWRRLFLGGILLLGLAVEGVAASSYLPIVLVFLAIGGIGNSLTAILLNTILQQSVPDHFRGRVFAFAGLTIQSMQMGAILLWGWRAQHFPLRSILAVAGLVALVAFPIGWTLWPFRDYTYASKKDLQALIDR